MNNRHSINLTKLDLVTPAKKAVALSREGLGHAVVAGNLAVERLGARSEQLVGVLHHVRLSAVEASLQAGTAARQFIASKLDDLRLNAVAMPSSERGAETTTDDASASVTLADDSAETLIELGSEEDIEILVASQDEDDFINGAETQDVASTDPF